MFAHPLSCTCGKSELEVFAVPPTQTSIEHSQYVEYRPIATLSDTAPIEFLVPGSDHYLDLNDTLLYLKLKITKENGAPIATTTGTETTTTKVSPINYLLNTLFQQVDVTLGTTVISSAHNTYAFSSYISALIGAPRSAKDTYLTNALWFKDKAGAMDKPNDQRAKLFENGAEVEIMGRIHADIFLQDRLLLNAMDLKLRFIRNKDSFCILTEADDVGTPKIHLLDASLFVRQVKIAPAVLEGHARALDVGPAKYPITRREVKTFAVAQGTFSACLDNVYQGALPRRLILAITDGDSYNGNIKLNPFNFKTHDLNFLCAYLDSDQIPAKALQPDFSKNAYARSYLNLFMGMEQLGGKTNIDISPQEFKDGYALFAFNLTPDQSAGGLSSGHLNLVRRGSIRIELRFKKALDRTINVLVFAETDSILEIDKARNVILDY